MIKTRRYYVAGAWLVVVSVWFYGLAATWAQNFAPLPPAAMPAPSIYALGTRGQIAIGSSANGLVIPSGPAGPGFSRRNGLQLSVKSEWPGQYGYHPLQVTVKSATPVTSDVALEFRFTGGTWAGASSGLNAREAFVLPQGQSSVTIQLLVPQFNAWSQCQWNLSVQGTRDDEFTVTYIDAGSIRGNFSNNAGDVAAIGVMLSDRQLNRVIADVGHAYSNPTPVFPRLQAEDLPTDWLAYTSLNLVVLPADKLPKLFNEHPQRAEALLRWVATGGNLWLIDAGRNWQELAEIEPLLNAASQGETASEEEGPLPPQWRFAPLDMRATEPAEGAVVLAGFSVDEAAVAKSREEREERRRRRRPDAPALPPFMGNQAGGMPGMNINNLPKTSAEWFAVRGWGLGVVTAFRKNLHGSNEMANQEATRVLGQSLLAPRQQWGGRFGSVPHDSNVDFNDWLIPGVGMAPIGSFQILITLFALAIGPFTYWILRRTGKLPMLIAIVPAAAIGTTLALFAYGILIDGVAARVRGRSVTLLDQTTGECTSWGRYSYYAGIAPRHGLTVPVDQAMFPLLPSWTSIFGFGGERQLVEREVIWNDQQRLTRGWLASRTPTQYHAIAARQSPKKLELRATPQGMRVTNRLGVELLGVAIQDHDNKFYWCESLPIEKGVVVPAVQHSEVASKVRLRFTENLPELPPGDDGRRRNTGYYSYALSDSVMEGRLSAINASQLTGWGPGRYIAFTSTAIELTPGVDEADEQQSFHVIEGSWQR